MTAIGEEMLGTLRDIYLFSYFTGSVEELSPDQLIQVYLRLLNVFDNNYNMKSNSGKQPHDPSASSGSALKHILKSLRSMELFHLVGSSKTSQVLDKRTSLRILSAMHDKITARHGSKTAHRVRIVVKADELARRARKKLPLDQQRAIDDVPTSKPQEKENFDSASIKEEADLLETKGASSHIIDPLASQEILKEVDRGAGCPLKAGSLPVLKVPKKGRELARTPVRPQSSTDNEGDGDESEDSVSLLPIPLEPLASPAHHQPDSAITDTYAKSSEPSKDFSRPTTTTDEVHVAGDVEKDITQPQSSAVSPMLADSCRSTNSCNVRKSVAPILSGACEVELPLTPVGAPASEDRNVIPSGRQIARTPVAASHGDDLNLEDSCVTPAPNDEVSVCAKTEPVPVRVGEISKDAPLEEEMKLDPDKKKVRTINVQLREEKCRPCDGSRVKNTDNETAGFESRASEKNVLQSTAHADFGLRVENNRSGGNVLIDSPVVKKILVRQKNSPGFIPFSPDKGRKGSENCSMISPLYGSGAQDIDNENGKSESYLSKGRTNSVVSSKDERDVKASPSFSRDLPLPLATAEQSSSSVDLGNIILEPPPGFNFSHPTDHNKEKVHSDSDLSDSFDSETCIKTHGNIPSVSFVAKESPDYLEVQKYNKDKTYNLELNKVNGDKRKTFVLSKTTSCSVSNVRRTTFVVPQNIDCANAVDLNTHDSRRRTFVIPSEQIASNTLVQKANESRELVSSPATDEAAFGELTLLSKDFGETFLVTNSAPDIIQDCSTGHLALSSAKESSSSIKCPRSDRDSSEEGSNSSSTPSSRRAHTDDVKYVPRGRQLYRTATAGHGHNETTCETENSDDCKLQAQIRDNGQGLQNGNKQDREKHSSANEEAVKTALKLKTVEEGTGDEGEESSIIEKSVTHESDAEIKVKVSSLPERDSTSSGFDETLSNESRGKPVRLELCINETFVTDSPNKSHKVKANVIEADQLVSGSDADINALKYVKQEKKDSFDLDDSDNLFAPPKNKQVKRNIPEEKQFRGASKKNVKRSRKDRIEELLIKQLKAEQILSPLNYEDDQTSISLRSTKEEASLPKLGRNKNNVNSATAKKKEVRSTASKRPAKTRPRGNLVPDDEGNYEAEVRDSKEKTTVPPRQDESDGSVVSTRQHRGKKFEQNTNSAPDNMDDENKGTSERFHRLKGNEKLQKVPSGVNTDTNPKITKTYSKKENKEQQHIASSRNGSTTQTKKRASETMILTEPQEPTESDDLIEECPEDGKRRSRRQRGTKVVDYIESPFVTPTLPPSKERRGRTAPCDATHIILSTHKGDNHFTTPSTSSPEPVVQPGTTDGDNLENQPDGLNVAHNFSRGDCDGNDSDIIPKQATRRGRPRGRGGRDGPSPILSAATVNTATRGRGRKQNTVVNTNESSDTPGAVAQAVKLPKKSVKSPVAALDSGTVDAHNSPALLGDADSSCTKGRGKRTAPPSQTNNKPGVHSRVRKRRNATPPPAECSDEVFSSGSKEGSETRRGRVRTVAGRGKGRSSKPPAPKGGQLEGANAENKVVVNEALESSPRKDYFCDVENISAKNAASHRVSRTVPSENCTEEPIQKEPLGGSDDSDESMNIFQAHSTNLKVKSVRNQAKKTKIRDDYSRGDRLVVNNDDIIKAKKTTALAAHSKTVRNRRVPKSDNKIIPELSSSPLLPDDLQIHTGERNTLPVKPVRKEKGTYQEENSEIETITGAETKNVKLREKRSPTITKTATKTRTKKSTAVKAETSSAPKRKRQGTSAKEHEIEMDEESPSKKLCEEELNNVADEVPCVEGESISSHGARRAGTNRTKAQPMNASRKVNLDGPVGTTAVKKRETSSKSRVVTDDSPVAIQASKPRVTKTRTGRAAVK